MASDAIKSTVDDHGVATVTIDRPERNNAYDGALIESLLGAMDALGEAPKLRCVVLRGNGRHFQAGADLKWIDAVRRADAEENLRVSRATARAIDCLNRLPVPTIALVQGGCFGGGTGIISACDVVIAADNAFFSIAEVRWGLHAAIIIPHLNDAMGVRQARRYAITGERFDAVEAARIGLVHEVVSLDKLQQRGQSIVDQVLQNAPQAIAETKAHILEHAWSGFGGDTFEHLVASHASKRQSDEGAEGLASFQEKRAAAWSHKKT